MFRGPTYCQRKTKTQHQGPQEVVSETFGEDEIIWKWSEGWDQVLSSCIVDKCQWLQRILQKIDPVGGLWSVSGYDEATMWADTSSIGIGALVEIAGHVIENVAWIRDQSDVRHINVAELEASIKTLSLATKWKLKCFVLKIDSMTVFGWLNKVINNVSRVRVRGLYQTVVLRRLEIVRSNVWA